MRTGLCKARCWVAGVTLLALLVGFGSWWLGAGPARRAANSSRATTLDPASAAQQVAGAVSLSDGLLPGAVADDGARLWVLAVPPPEDDERPPQVGILLGLDRVSGEELTRTELSGSPSEVVTGGGAVWVTRWDTGAASRLDPATGKVVATISLELPFDFGAQGDREFLPSHAAFGHGSLWVLTARGALARIDPATNRVAAMIELTPPHPLGLAVGDDALWVAEDVHGLSRVDVASNQVRTVPLEDLDHAAGLVAVHDGAVWVVGNRLARTLDGKYFSSSEGGYLPADSDTISRLDPDTLLVTATASTPPGWFRALGVVGGVFGALTNDGTFVALNPAAPVIGAPVVLNARATDALVDDKGQLWLLAADGTIAPAARRID